MTQQLDELREILAKAFQATRKLLGLSVEDYSNLFEAPSEIILQLEKGVLPESLDDKTLKLLLALTALQNSPDALRAFLAIAKQNSPLSDDQGFSLWKLFDPDLVKHLVQYPWISGGTRFRCRLLQLTDQANGILLWAESQNVHKQLVDLLTQSANAHLNLVDNYTVIFIPKIYLFLKLDTTKSQLPILLCSRFNEKLPIGLSIPKEAFQVKSPTQLEVEETPRKLFIYSPDSNTLSEIIF